MAIASDFLIGANDEHGLNPPTVGKRTPVISYIGRSFYENEFNKEAKLMFILACLRCGFNVYDIHPEVQDISVSTRVVRARRANVSLLVTFAYNAAARDDVFGSANGVETFYSPINPFVSQSRNLATRIQNRLVEGTKQTNRGVKSANYYMLRAVVCPAALVEAGFMTNLREAKLMMDPDFQRQVGEETCHGVCDYLGVSYKKAPSLTYPTLRRGSKGDKVKYLQYKLLSKLYNPASDGVNSSIT